MLAAKKMKYAFMMNRYPAPRSISHLPFAIENPQVQSGGIKAVAIATPGITVFVLSSLVCPMIPAIPPKNAISTSKKVGDVLASNSYDFQAKDNLQIHFHKLKLKYSPL